MDFLSLKIYYNHNMKKLLFAFFTCLIIQNCVYALDVVYPTSTYARINSPTTFFVGNIKYGDKLFINNEQIEVHRTGAFAKQVKLNTGRNEFTLCADGKTKTYVIERPYPCKCTYNASYKEYSIPVTVETARNGVPIRTTPVQSGINRASHFQKGIELNAIGELDNMYKIQLSSNETVWIAKRDVKVKSNPYHRAFLFDYRSKENDSEYIYEFVLSQKTPYVITEGDVMTLKIFNVGANDDNTAVFKITLNQRLMGYDLKYKGNTLILSIKKEPKTTRIRPLKNVKIVVDAGHGGKELGAVSCSRNYEKDFNLSISKYLEKNLRSMGANVYMTRYTDKYVSLNDRVKYTNEKNAQIFVSIHANSLPDSKNPQDHRGSSIYYYYDEAKPLSNSILNSIEKSMNVNIEGVKQASFAVVRNTSAVSVLVETAYVINPYDNELLMNNNFRQEYAKAIADGIKNYVLQNKTRTAWNNRHNKTKMKFEKIS